MFKRATGWLGYTPAIVRVSNVNDLLLALGGRSDMLVHIFGGKDAQTSDHKPAPLSADKFRDIAKTHNNRLGQKK